MTDRDAHVRKLWAMIRETSSLTNVEVSDLLLRLGIGVLWTA